jgi:hypothetical protein
MATAMFDFKQTATAHMRRDLEASGKWTCTCEACHGIRSLVGMEKALDIRSFVREIEKTEDQMKDLPDGPEKAGLKARYLQLHDQLAEELAK